MKDDHLVERALEFASLYIIAQRPVITFENVIPDLENHKLNFEIHQKGSETVIDGRSYSETGKVQGHGTRSESKYFNFIHETPNWNKSNV